MKLRIRRRARRKGENPRAPGRPIEQRGGRCSLAIASREVRIHVHADQETAATVGIHLATKTAKRARKNAITLLFDTQSSRKEARNAGSSRRRFGT